MVTVTFTVPVPAGAVTVSEAPPAATTIEVPGFPVPKSTAVAPVKPVPETVTVLVPAAGPLVGLTPVTVGGVDRFPHNPSCKKRWSILRRR